MRTYFEKFTDIPSATLWAPFEPWAYNFETESVGPRKDVVFIRLDSVSFVVAMDNSMFELMSGTERLMYGKFIMTWSEE